MGVGMGGSLVHRREGWGSVQQNRPNPCFLLSDPTQIIFEGVRGSGYLGDIAIDDVTLKKGECPRKQMDPNKGEDEKWANLWRVFWVGTCVGKEGV